MKLSDPWRSTASRLGRLRAAGARQAAAWNERMLAEDADETRRGTRWGAA
ncbi:cholesterol esterase, partial [Streptomyces sp. MBRL 601]